MLLWFYCGFLFSVGWWSNLVFDALDRLMVKPVCYTSKWFKFIGSKDEEYEEYQQKKKSNLLLVLVVSMLTWSLDRKCFLHDILVGWYVHKIATCGLTENFIVVIWSVLVKSSMTCSLVNNNCWTHFLWKLVSVTQWNVAGVTS